ncbi:MAG: aldo/keto reductase [Armatimonadota bacterium]
MTKKLRWGIIGTGRIAGVFAEAVNISKTGELAAVASRSREQANQFADKYKIPKFFSNYNNFVDEADVDAVYVATPHPMHAEWVVKCANKGMHILCEKPAGINYPQVMAMVDACNRNNVVLMEAFMYRCHPQTAKLIELIKSGAIGDVKLIRASFAFGAEFNPESRLFSQELGGGGILDVGCYTVSMARLIAGCAIGKDFAEPIDFQAVGYLGATGVDEWTTAVAKFPCDIVAQLATGVRFGLDNRVYVYGTKGNIEVPSPWFCSPSQIVLNVNGEKPQIIKVKAPENIYTIEADSFAEAVKNKSVKSPCVSACDCLGNMRVLDTWRKCINLEYESEKHNSNWQTIDKKPLEKYEDAPMKYGYIGNLEKPVSKLVMGVMLAGAQFPLPHASVIFDEFFRMGGNCFDTAHIYGGGLSDTILGQWIKNRNIREEVVILAKGAHPPNCTPEGMTLELLESLERLQTDYVDIYMLHRDNLNYKVSDFIDVLNQHIAEGRIRVIGASNWTLERYMEANEYAASKGLSGFSAISNNLSLATMVKPVWDGCLSVSDTKSRKWLSENQVPVMAWSSLARGFFARGDSDESLRQSWFSEENFHKLERARTLAEKKGTDVNAVALAWVLNQDFPVYALFGPADIFEMKKSFEAFNVILSEDEMKWLNLEK